MANQGGLLSSEDINDGMITFLFSVTLHDIVHTDKSLTLVFEYLERDLKQYMDDCGAILSMNNVKLFLYQVLYLHGSSSCYSSRVFHTLIQL